MIDKAYQQRSVSITSKPAMFFKEINDSPRDATGMKKLQRTSLVKSVHHQSSPSSRKADNNPETYSKEFIVRKKTFEKKMKRSDYRPKLASETCRID